MTARGVHPMAELTLAEVEANRELRPATWMNGSKTRLKRFRGGQAWCSEAAIANTSNTTPKGEFPTAPAKY